MTWDTIQQLIRIVGYSAGAFFFGTSIADGALFQAALAGGINVLAFAWWVAVERNKAIAPK